MYPYIIEKRIAGTYSIKKFFWMHINSQINKIELTKRRIFIVLFTPITTGMVFVFTFLSPSTSLTSKTTVFTKHLMKRKTKIMPANKIFPPNTYGRRVEESAHDIETVKFFAKNKSFNLKDDIFMLYISPIIKGIKKIGIVYLFFNPPKKIARR
jgi:hypothetical protein